MRRVTGSLAVIAAITLAACAGDGSTTSNQQGGTAALTAAPTVATVPPDPTTAVSTTTVPSSLFSEPFEQPDGPLANGWTNPTSAPTMQVVGGMGSSDGAGAYRVAFKHHGVDVSGDWQIDVDVDAPTGDDEGVSVLLVDAAFKGVGFFAGNAVHIQEFTGGSEHINRTNNGRPGGGSPGHLAQHVRMTFRKATGEYVVYLDGEQWASASAPEDHFASTAGDTIVILAGSIHTPTYEATLDNLTLKGSIG